MKNKFTLLLSTLLVFLTITASADKRNILFVGNSYTYVNDLPKMLADVANSLGDTVTHDSSTPGGYTAQQHTTNTTTLSKIAQGGWDYVTIQCQSQEPSFSLGQVMTQTYPYVMYLDSAIQAGSTCAETLFYMTWGRKNGDTQNNPNDTYDAMQQRLRQAYLLFADSANASVSPVGAAWKVMRDSLPNIDLYNADQSHPSINGTYLAACVFYCIIFKKSCLGSMFLPGGVGNGDAFAMQQIASMVVLDSLENWQGEGSIPDASFTFTASVPPPPNFLTFTNTSKRYTTSSWDFGDGSPTGNPATNPVHPFPATGGTYNVCLEVTSVCGKKDTTCQTVMVSPSGTSSFSATDKIKVTQSAEQIFISNDYGNCIASLLDINGKEIYSTQLETGNHTISTSRFAKGIYLLKISSSAGPLVIKKMFNY